MTAIQSLINAGADAMSNMYEVIFYPPNPLTPNDQDWLKIRVKGFTPPNPEHLTYDVNWKAISIKRPATKITLDRTLEFEFRLDANYRVYQGLLTWQKYTSDATAGYADNEISGGGTIKVRALKVPVTSAFDGTADEIAAGDAAIWEFKDVWITKVTPPTYATDDATALTVSATFAYGEYSGPDL